MNTASERFEYLSNSTGWRWQCDLLLRRRASSHPGCLKKRYALRQELPPSHKSLRWRYIDAALIDPRIEVAKFTSIPLLVGATLALAWAKSHPFLRGFLKANAISMLGVLAFLYLHAPLRICNSYLVADQERLGFAFLVTAVCLSALWAVPLFMAPPEDAETTSHSQIILTKLEAGILRRTILENPMKVHGLTGFI